MLDRQPEKEGPEQPSSAWVESGRYAGLGLQLAGSIGLFLWLGWKLDQWAGLTPLFTIVGAFVGAGAGFYSLYRQLILASRDGDELRR